MQEWIYAHTVDIGVVTLPVERLKTVSIAQDRFKSGTNLDSRSISEIVVCIHINKFSQINYNTSENKSKFKVGLC